MFQISCAIKQMAVPLFICGIFYLPAKAEDSRKLEAVNIQVDTEQVAKRLSEGVKFTTVSHQDRNDFDIKAFEGYHRFLEKSYPLVHKTLKRETLGSPRKFSLLYTWRGKEPSLSPIVLMAHQDVVPVVPGTEKQWEQGPFSGHIDSQYIWGRGTLDDKSMVQAPLEAIEMLVREGFQPNRTIYLIFGQDEEVGGSEGVKQIAKIFESRGIKDIALILDEGLPLTNGLFPGIKNPIALIGTAEKGYLSLELRVASPGGHSAMPPENSNIGVLAKAISKLEANQFSPRLTETVREQFQVLAPYLSKADQNALKSDKTFIDFMLKGPQTTAMVRTTTAVTMFNGGIKENVLPPFASAVVNFRLLQGDTVDSVIQRVKSVIGDKRVAVKDISESINPSPISSAKGNEFKLIEKTIRETWGTPDLIVSPYLVIGGTDSKWFAASNMAKNVYRFTPVRVESAADSERWHGVNERVLKSEYARSIGFYHRLITNSQELQNLKSLVMTRTNEK